MNPFANYGRIVHGDRFIGRETIVNNIENRIIHPDNPGNLVIIGMHRIGKSSLAHKAIIEQKDNLIRKGVLPIWMGVASYDLPSDFFHALVKRCVREMTRLDWLSHAVQNLANYALEIEDSWDEIKDFFIEVKEIGYQMLLILDEFDHARHLFKGNTAFQRLRELADYPDYGFSLVLTSRRSIRDIERLAGSTSPFHNIFQVQRLGMFNNDDLEIYFSRFSDIGISISDEQKTRVLFYCGAHPYLLEMLGWEIVEGFRQNQEQEIDVDEAADNIQQSIFDHYDDMIRLLREEETLNKLLQILFGPVIDVKQPDVTELQSYGLIIPNENETYSAYSEHLHDYLKIHERSTEFINDLHAIWSKTENALREIITTIMSDLYGDNWIAELEKTRPNFKKNIFDPCRDRQQHEERIFAERASQNLIDFTYPAQLFDIICAKGLWQSHFQAIFGENQNYWGERSRFLTKCRTPLGHNRDNILRPDQRKIFEAYCDEILGILSFVNSA
ncbi:MAG: ATP-binding protein [Candidatus Poribacteria bacterium]|nr:ATP-binding protein [Candidatus Poribacteria bacterium]